MHLAALRISPPDAKSAVPQRRMLREVQEKCSMHSVLSAARIAKCPSSLPKESLFIAASALLQKERQETNFT